MHCLKTISVFIVSVIIWNGCSSSISSMEFTTAMTKARAERDSDGAEEWALKAMELPVHVNDGEVPLFLAREVYKPQNKWEKMSEMLDEAIKRNPSQLLKKPLTTTTGDKITTVEGAVKVLRDEAWGKVFNSGVEKYDASIIEGAIDLIKLAIKIDKNRIEAYLALSGILIAEGKADEAKSYIDLAYTIDDNNYDVLLLKSEVYKNNQNYQEALNLLYNAKAMQTTTSEADLEIFNIYLLQENYSEALQFGVEIVDNLDGLNQDIESIIYFNLAQANQYLGKGYYDQAINVFNILNQNDDDVTLSDMKDCVNNFKVAKNFFIEAKIAFYDSDSRAIENNGSLAQAKEMKRVIELIENSYIPSVEARMN